MEPLMATAAEATDMLRVGRSAVYRLIAARQRESIKIGRPQRASVASITSQALAILSRLTRASTRGAGSRAGRLTPSQWPGSAQSVRLSQSTRSRLAR